MPPYPQDLRAICRALRGLLEVCQPPLVAKADDARRLDLWSVKDGVISRRKRSEVFFASVIIQESYVGFYFMPVVAAPEMKGVFGPELLALLKRQGCFHIQALAARPGPAHTLPPRAWVR